MINRTTLQCASCSEEITVRISFGHGDRQVHIFPCPSCLIEIVVTLDIDQVAAGWRYHDPINAKQVDRGGEDSRFIRTFDGDNLIPRDTGGLPAFPFVMNSHNPRNPDKSHEDEALRNHLYATYWTTVRRMRTHFDNRAITLFDKEMAVFENDFTNQPWQPRVHAFCSMTQNFIARFLPAQAQSRKRANQIISAATRLNKAATIEFAQEALGSGRTKRLWAQAWEVREMYMKLFPVFHPLVKFSEWRSEFIIKDYFLSEKRFEEIRPLFANSFETLSKLSTIAIAFEQLSKSQKIEIQTRKGSMTLDEYDGLANGSKPDLLAKFEIAPLFVPFMDNHLRNGIGHNSAHYVAKDDSVWYRSSRGEKVVEENIDYTEFCYRTLQLVAATESAIEFLNATMVLGQRNTIGIMGLGRRSP